MRRGNAGIAGGLTILAAAGLFYFALARPVQVLPRMEPVPVFELLDHRGETFRSQEGGRGFTIYTVGATRDRAGLQAVQELAVGLEAALSRAGGFEGVALVWISIDPGHDTPEVLREAAAGFPPVRALEVRLLTGPWVATRLAVGTGLGIYHEPPAVRNGRVEFVYEPDYVVVDREGIVRARHPAAEVTVELLLRDLRLLSQEARAAGATRLLYEGAHLFLCYPR